MSSIVGRFLGPLFVQEVPSGAIDGSNVTFNLSFSPAAGNAVLLFLDGLKLKQNQYSIVGTVITMVDAPVLGQDFCATYTKA